MFFNAKKNLPFHTFKQVDALLEYKLYILPKRHYRVHMQFYINSLTNLYSLFNATTPPPPPPPPPPRPPPGEEQKN